MVIFFALECISSFVGLVFCYQFSKYRLCQTSYKLQRNEQGKLTRFMVSWHHISKLWFYSVLERSPQIPWGKFGYVRCRRILQVLIAPLLEPVARFLIFLLLLAKFWQVCSSDGLFVPLCVCLFVSSSTHVTVFDISLPNLTQVFVYVTWPCL